MENTPRPGIDFLPLTVDYEERLYAAGKIPGSFFRREGRPAQDAPLTARLPDRPPGPAPPRPSPPGGGAWGATWESRRCASRSPSTTTRWTKRFGRAAAPTLSLF